MRQSMAAVVEREFTAALRHVLQGNPGCDQEHRLLDRDKRGILVWKVAVAPLEQQLLHRDRAAAKYQRQEAQDARVHAHKARRFKVDVKVEQALERVRHGSRKLMRIGPTAMVGANEHPWVLLNVPDIVDQSVDQRLGNGLAPDQPAMLDEMGEVIVLAFGAAPGGRRRRKLGDGIRGIGPERFETDILLKSGRHRRPRGIMTAHNPTRSAFARRDQSRPWDRYLAPPWAPP